MTYLSTDTGGTFTDFVLLTEKRLWTFKVPSTPGSPDEAIREGLARIDRPIQVFSHGTTVATNLVLERKGPVTALVTTSGFRDVIEIGRQVRPSLYEPVPRPEPLVPSDMRFEVSERVGSEGEVLTPLRRKEVRRLVKEVRESGATSVAISLLFSFMDPSHERELGKMVRKLGVEVSLSSQVLPVFREYERTSTTVMDAYVKPKMAQYIKRLGAIFPDSRIEIMQSNGGTAHPSIIRRRPVSTLFSGPAGGVAASQYVARKKGLRHVITFDMGGTSTDVSTIMDGQVQFRSGTTVGGLPVHMPMVDIETVGAGGGSLVWLDEGGSLRVGPESAGADPGPVCYGRSGRVPTITDCDLLAGFIDPDNFLGGRMPLDMDKAAGAVEGLGSRAGLDRNSTIRGAIAVVNSHMTRAIRVVTVERGLDPSNFTMVAFGGAGPMHAAMVARELGIKDVIIPFAAGVFSALGLIVSDDRSDHVITRAMDPSSKDAQTAVDAVFDELDTKAKAELKEQGIAVSRTRFQRSLDMRYKGQSFEVNVPYSGKVDKAINDLHNLHERLYTYSMRGRRTEIVNVRLTTTHTSRPDIIIGLEGEGREAPSSTRKVHFDTDRVASIHQWSDLRPGHSGKGPAIIEEAGFTAVVPPGFSWSMDKFGNIELRDGGGR